MKTDVKKLENAQVEISVTLPLKDVEKFRDEVEKEAIKNVKIDGFREGKVPKEIAMKHIQPLRVFEEMAQKAISASYVEVLEKTKVKAIGQPQIMITKIAEGSDLEFKIVTAVLPDVKLANYKKIAKDEMKKEMNLELDEKEIKLAIDNIRKMRAQQTMSENLKEGEVAKSWNEIEEKDLPELTDEFVKSVGKFENVEDFKNKIIENLKEEKKARELEKRRIALIDGILEKSEIEVPQMLVSYEIDKMMYEFESNIAMTGMSFDDYLKSIKKTRDDYRKEWAEQGKKRAQTQIMLNEIAKKEKIEVDDKEIEVEVSKIMEQYKDQKNIDENNVRAYVAEVLTHQKVFEFLENQK
jgi:FKBP-type peptidyl-prolyl cis-trans isomerase (trigger factor)